MLHAGSVIGKLRVRTRRPDSAALRLAIERQVQAGEFQLRGIGPSAILLIRRMADPLPHSLQSDLREARAQAEWQRALRGRIDSLCAVAARPADGRLAGDAEAVLFADEAELLACLALELARGASPSWWRLAVARYFNPRLSAMCRGQPHLLPAMFALLARWDKLGEVVGALSDGEALELCAVFAAAHELHALSNLVMRFHAGMPHAGEGGSSPEARGQISTPETIPESRHDIAAGEPAAMAQIAAHRIYSWIPAGCAAQSLPRRLLLAVVLGFRQQPSVLGSRRFVAELEQWLRADVLRVEAESPQPTAADSRVASLNAGTLAPNADSMNTEAPPAAKPQPRSEAEAPQATAATPDAAHSTAAEIAAPSPEPPARLDGIVTELGGVFCLINVMEHLGLPDCFEDSCGLATRVGAFGTLEAIARVLAGTLGDELRHDPVWALLATLDGREPNTPPRASGLRPVDKLPAEWNSVTEGMVPTLEESHAQTLEALRREGWPPALIDWLTLAIPHISARIALACGLPDFAAVARMLLELPARVYVTEAHIDVVASLENIRVPIRLAGLDRSPGWVRSLQRVVLIHFE